MAKDLDEHPPRLDDAHQPELTGIPVIDADIQRQTPENVSTAPKYGVLERFGAEFGIHRKPTTMMAIAMAAGERRKDYLGILAAMMSIIQHSLDEDYLAFEMAFNEWSSGDEEAEAQMVAGVVEEILATTSGTPKARAAT